VSSLSVKSPDSGAIGAMSTLSGHTRIVADMDGISPTNKLEIDVSTVISEIMTLNADMLIYGNIYKAYYFLTKIEGIGDKIACLFLRDISIIHNLNLYGDCRDLLYKPIDGVVTKVIDELVKCKCKLDYDFDINESLKILDPKEVKCIEQLRKKAKIKNEDFKKLYPYKIFLYYYSKRCNLDQRWVEMGMWFFRSKVMNYYNKKLCDYTIKSACEDLIRRLRNAIKNTNIKYIGNDQFEIIDANGNKIRNY
jgi:hypothetical protein